MRTEQGSLGVFPGAIDGRNAELLITRRLLPAGFLPEPATPADGTTRISALPAVAGRGIVVIGTGIDSIGDRVSFSWLKFVYNNI